VHIDVKAWIGGTAITIAAAPTFAFLAASSDANPVTEDWLTGEWLTGWARVLVGPNGGTVSLEAGTYSVWISFAAGLETPVYRAGELTVY
jgi:hypothetical protein